MADPLNQYEDDDTRVPAPGEQQQRLAAFMTEWLSTKGIHLNADEQRALAVLTGTVMRVLGEP